MTETGQRNQKLDAVRGLAVLIVIIHNESSKYPILHLQYILRSGWMGVDLFFVLSGFLITGILLGARSSPHYFRNFYARRCLRIWPLYYAVLVFMFVLVPFFRPAEAQVVFGAKSSPWWAYPVFLQNFLVPVPTSATGPLGVTWSLAVEEQFYLVWPWLVRYCSDRQLRRIGLLIIGASPLFRLYLSWQNVNIYSNPFCRLDGLMAGSLIALAMQSRLFGSSRTKVAGTVLIAALGLGVVADHLDALWIAVTLATITAASFLHLALSSDFRWLRAVLSNRFLVYAGGISYGLYLLHKIPFDILQGMRLDRYPVLNLVIGFPAAFGLAALSWKLLESPFMQLKRFFPSGRPILPAQLSTRSTASTTAA